jgi:hypothetical protein
MPPELDDRGEAGTGRSQRLHLVIYQDAADVWLARGLEHDLMAEARSIGAAVRALVRLVEAHTGFDLRHDHVPLAAIRSASQSYWNAYASGTQVPLTQLGIDQPPYWEIRPAVAHRRPADPPPPSRSADTTASRLSS